jgi:DNA-binding transcriptional regulator YhcF (GntR family)
VENALRERLESGAFGLNQYLPPQRELAEEYGVSRDTIQRVLRRLTEEGWLESRQGSGVKVVKVPRTRLTRTRPEARGRVSLGPLINRAFEQDEVSLDVASLTSETLLRHLLNQEERVVAREIGPRKLRIRMLLPWEEQRLAYPSAVDRDDARIWERWREMVREHRAALDELAVRLRNLDVDTRIDVRRVPMTPQFKLYVLNDSDMLFGPYEVVPRSIPREGESVAAVDVLGAGSTLSYHRWEDDEESHDSLFFASMRDWFRSNWEWWGEPQLRSEGASDETPR